MEDRLGSLTLNGVDTRGTYYNRSVKSSSNIAAASANSTTTNGICMLANGHRVQQRYKLLTDGPVQVCRVPHAKNIIEKIRFSRFLRRWEEHYITLTHNQILSETVCSNRRYLKNKMIYLFFFRMKVIWIRQFCILQLKIYLYGQKQK
jgi:hypothetical protein